MENTEIIEFMNWVLELMPPERDVDDRRRFTPQLPATYPSELLWTETHKFNKDNPIFYKTEDLIESWKASKVKCNKCNGEMRAGKALNNPPIEGSEGHGTMSQGNSIELVSVMKCLDCGHSFCPSKDNEVGSLITKKEAESLGFKSNLKSFDGHLFIGTYGECTLFLNFNINEVSFEISVIDDGHPTPLLDPKDCTFKNVQRICKALEMQD